jgi:hypothetical protein
MRAVTADLYARMMAPIELGVTRGWDGSVGAQRRCAPTNSPLHSKIMMMAWK